MSASIDRRHVAARHGAPADIEQQPAAMREVAACSCAAASRAAAPSSAAAHDVEVARLLHVERRHADALAAGIDQEALAAQQHHRLQHRLAADAELLGELFLGEAGAGFQFARADGFENGVVDAFAEIGFGQEGSHDVCIQNTERSKSIDLAGFQAFFAPESPRPRSG